MTPPIATDTHRQSLTTPFPAVAQELQAALGQALVARAANLKTPKTVGRWLQGIPPRSETEQRTRTLYRTVLILRVAYAPETVRGWLLSPHPHMAQQAPIDAIRDGRDADVIGAAEAFCSAELDSQAAAVAA